VVGRLFFVTLTTVGAVGTAAVYLLGGHMALRGDLTPGSVVAFAMLVTQAYAPLAALSNAPVEVLTALVSFDRVFEVLDLQPLIRDPEQPRPIPDGPVSIEFDDVRFAYPSAEKVSLASLEEVATLDTRGGEQVLHGINLRAEPGQVVAAGTTGQLAAFAENPPEKARLRPLSVAGAFHTEHMAPAVERVRAAAAALSPSDPVVPILSNADGAVVESGKEYLDRLVSQISSPVRWDACTQTLADLGVTALIELTPAGTLTGLAKRALRGIDTLAVKTPEDIERAGALIKEHAGTSAAGTDQEG
jgi:hypothetical protein